MFCSVLRLIVLPSRSWAVSMSLSPRTQMCAQAFSSSSASWTPCATMRTGRPWLAAISIEVVLENPNCRSPLCTAGRISAPPANSWVSTLRFSSSKKPSLIPR